MVKIGIYRLSRKGAEHYRYVAEGRPGNPTSIYKDNFISSHGLFFDSTERSVSKLAEGDQDETDDLRKKLLDMGVIGVVQVRVARGGVGGGRGINGVKWGMRQGTISTQGKGFPLIVRELWI